MFLCSFTHGAGAGVEPASMDYQGCPIVHSSTTELSRIRAVTRPIAIRQLVAGRFVCFLDLVAHPPQRCSPQLFEEYCLEVVCLAPPLVLLEAQLSLDFVCPYFFVGY